MCHATLQKGGKKKQNKFSENPKHVFTVDQIIGN